MKTKRIIMISWLLLSLCLAACSNDDEGQDNANVCLLFGKWVLDGDNHRAVLLFRSDGTGYYEYPLEGQLRHVDFTYTYKEETNYPSDDGLFIKAYTVWYKGIGEGGSDLFLISKDGKMMSPFSSSMEYFVRQ